MKIVIDIDKEIYNHIKNGYVYYRDITNIYKAVDKAIVLPKGHGRRFEEIVVRYLLDEICIYPEYRGKPYFLIQYEENGEHIIGFGTYKPEVLSSYLREYFIAPIIIEADKGEE